MSSKLYEIEVIFLSGKEVHLKVTIIHPDERFIYEKKNFALQLLWDPADPNFVKPCALNRAIPLPKIYDVKWVIQHQDEFIREVRISERHNYPAKPEWTSDITPSVVLVVSVNDSSYLEHLSLGLKWRSAAYDMERYL